MKILFLAAEAAPLVKVGGLADVAGALPKALLDLGCDIRLGLPHHASTNLSQLEIVEHFRGGQSGKYFGPDASLLQLKMGKLPVLLFEEKAFLQEDRIYLEAEADVGRYSLFSLGILEAVEQMGWQPDILHANDWHTAAAILSVHARREPGSRHPATLFTIHNLPYMGAPFDEVVLKSGYLPEDRNLIPAAGRSLPLPLAIGFADRINTVSPTYANEIQTAFYGNGLEELLIRRVEDLSGILNGIDFDLWDPSADPSLPLTFDAENLQNRAILRSFLQSSLGLEPLETVPLLGMVTRLSRQKGVDLMIEALSLLKESPWQFILLGTGDEKLEKSAWQLQNDLPSKVRFVHRFDEVLARRIFGGVDMLLIPSRYEPSGLSQMIGMRYGSIPIVRATGGLRDSVVDYEPGAGGTGFVFDQPTASELVRAIQRAIRVWEDHRKWRPLQKRAMNQDFSWSRSANQYLDLYQDMLDDGNPQI